jgi:hypothetical protein
MYGGLTGGGAIFYTYTGAVGSETYSERMRIDASGNVGIGTTSPSQKLEVASGSMYVNSGNGDGLIFNGSMGIFRASSTSLAFNTGGTERARIDSNGNLLVGTTALGGSSSNAALIIGGGIRTAAGLLSSIASGTATTAFSITAANRGRYEVVAMIANSGDASIYSAISTVIWDGTTGRAVSNNGTLFTITLSGSNVQVTQISGSAQDVYWSFQRIAL